MVRSLVYTHSLAEENEDDEIRQINSGYNNVFLGGNGRVILGEDHIDDIDCGKMNLPRDVWKSGDRKAINQFVEIHKDDDATAVLGLECFDLVGRKSNRIHHMHQDRNVTVRMQRYHEKGPS